MSDAVTETEKPSDRLFVNGTPVKPCVKIRLHREIGAARSARILVDPSELTALKAELAAAKAGKP